MKTKTKSYLAALFVILFISAAFAIYYVKLSLSESLKFENGSLPYRLLTPNILKNFNARKIGKVKYFYYSAADGNKPLINAIELVSSQKKEFIEQLADDYFIQHHYLKSGPGQYKKDRQNVYVSILRTSNGHLNINITVSETL